VKTATELLASLRQQPTVEFALPLRCRGKLFATYPADLPEGAFVPAPPTASGATFIGSDRLDITEKVASGETR